MIGIGTQVGQYEVVEKIGEGGMGVIYRAWDKKLLRNVAFKVLPRDTFVEERHRKRFLREARLGSALEHPGVVTVFDFITHEGCDVLVMEYVQGKSLRDLLKNGPLPWQRVARYGLGIGAAVQAAHERGIIHRDLKPENILVTPDGRLKVLDFGISSLSRGSEQIKRLTTLPSSEDLDRPLPGTLLYMSPEQTLGEPIDPRSDLFTFGVLLYEMLSGKQPFFGDTALAYLHRLHYADVEPIDQLCPGVPSVLVELVSACLQRQRKDRPPDMSAVLSRLNDLQAPEADALAPLSRTPSPRRIRAPFGLTDFPRWKKLAGLTLGLLLLTSGGLFWHQERSSVGVDETFASSPTASPSTSSTSTASPLERDRDPISTFELYRQAWSDLRRFDRPGRLDRAIEGFERVVASGEMRAAAQAGLARAYWRRYRWKSFDPHWLERATAVAERAVELNGDLAEARISLGLVELEKGHHAAAEEQLQHALRLDPENSEAHFALARMHITLGDDEAAQKAFKASFAAGKNDRELHDLWGSLHYRRGRYPEAALAFEKSIEHAPDSTVGYRNLAAVFFKLERFGESAAELQKALAIEPSPDLYANLGTLYYYQGLYAESAEALEKALHLPGGTHRYINWGNFADACRQVPGREDEAKDAYLRALQMLDEILRDGGALNAAQRSRRSLYRARSGDTEGALADLNGLEDADWEQPDILYRAAVVQELSNHRELALNTLARALEAGYPLGEVRRDPDFIALRDDVSFHRLLIARQKEAR